MTSDWKCLTTCQTPLAFLLAGVRIVRRPPQYHFSLKQRTMVGVGDMRITASARHD